MLWTFHSFISNHRIACCLGSGKSYTMMGSQDHKGIIPRLCDSLFDLIAKQQSSELMYKVEVSYMEIYNEKVQHLNKVFQEITSIQAQTNNRTYLDTKGKCESL